jgi:WD40 repeat protein
MTVKVTELGGRPVVVSGSADWSVRVWDLATGSPIGNPITGHSGRVRTMSIAKLHERLVVASSCDDGSVLVSDLKTGCPVRTHFAGHADSVHALTVAYVHGRPMVASGSADCSILIWDLETGRIDQVIKNLNGPVIDIALESDGRSLRALVGDSSGTVLTYSLVPPSRWGKRVASHFHRHERKGLKDIRHDSSTGALCYLDFPLREVVGYGTKLHIHTAANSQVIDIDSTIHGIKTISSDKLIIATSRGIVMLRMVASDA